MFDTEGTTVELKRGGIVKPVAGWRFRYLVPPMMAGDVADEEPPIRAEELIGQAPADGFVQAPPAIVGLDLAPVQLCINPGVPLVGGPLV